MKGKLHIYSLIKVCYDLLNPFCATPLRNNFSYKKNRNKIKTNTRIVFTFIVYFNSTLQYECVDVMFKKQLFLSL